MMKKHMWLLLIVFVIPLLSCQFVEALAKEALQKAVATMRLIDSAVFNEEQQERKSEELDRAFKTLVDAGVSGAEILKEELRKLEATKEKDDFFKLGAAVYSARSGE